MMNWEAVGRMVLDRIGERSTWLGMAAVLASLGVTIDGNLLNHITGIGMGLAGVVGIFWPDEATPRKLTKDDLQATGRMLKRHE